MSSPADRPVRAPRPRLASALAVGGVAGALLAGTALIPAAAPLAAAATSLTVTASADTYVDSARPASNFGARTSMNADGSPAQAMLLRFSIPAGTTVHRATLRLLPTGDGGTGLAAHITTTSWTETGATWSNAPRAGARVASVPVVTSGTWAELDITSIAQAGGLVNLWVTTPGERRIPIRTREAGASSAPQLVLELAATPTPSPTPTVTPTSSPTISPSPTPSPTATPTSPTATPTTSTTHAKVIVVGDVQVLDSRLDENLATSNLALAETGVDLILNTGDTADDGRLSSLQNPTWGWPAHWGRSWLWDKLRVVPGNHDYLVGNAADFKAFFGDRAGPANTFYRSFDIAGWHIIQLNSNIAVEAGSAQYAWLSADLSANRTKPTIALWHHPRFTSGTYADSTKTSDVWRLLSGHPQVEMVFSGHDHTYQRYTRVLDTGAASATTGIVQWIASIASGNRAIPVDRPVLAARNTTRDQLGILVLDLYRDRYTWRFEATPGSAPDLNDTGSQAVRVPAA